MDVIKTISSKKRSYMVSLFSIITFVFLFGFPDAVTAQSVTNTQAGIGNAMSYYLLTGMALLFMGITIYVLRYALTVLRQNGRSVTFTFPSRWMAEHNGSVTFIILLALVAGVILAVTF